MEVNGIAHIFLTASNYERSRDFYRKLLPFLGLKPVIDTETTYYCVGGRTAVGISAPSAEHEGAAFEQKRVGLHHLCFRARERADVDELHGFLTTLGAKIIRAPREDQWARDIIRFCSRIPTASGSSSIMCRGRGCWGSTLRSCAGWVERSDTHHVSATGLMGFASLYPSYALVVQRCLMQIARASKSSCCHHVMRCLVVSICSRAPLRWK